MPLANLDTGGIARCLAQIAERPDDRVEAFFEIATEARVSGSTGRMMPQSRAEQGLAVRLLRDGEVWLSSADGISPETFAHAVARVARARPGAVAPAPGSLAGVAPALDVPGELTAFAKRAEQVIGRRHAAFSVQWDVREHRRWSRVIGSLFAPDQQVERFYSCAARTAWANWGTLLLELGEEQAEAVAASLTRAFRAQRAPATPEGRVQVVLGPAAAAVFLHEAVAHALETDTLMQSGDPRAALGMRLAAGLDVVDNPAGAPERVRRSADDEGVTVVDRWLLRGGVVEQPLADLRIAGGSTRLVPGAARRGHRHLAPVPRSTHLELLPGDADLAELVARCGSGIFVEEVSRGSLDSLSGRLELEFPYARRIEDGRVGGLSGPGQLSGVLADLLQAVLGVGSEPAVGGAGWCAKGGHRLPVWAAAPALAIDGFEVGP